MTVTVHGSINVDLIHAVDRLPRAGETVIATGVTRMPGGKGANQAIAAARAGATVAMCGRVGDDAAGRFMIAQLHAAGVDCSAIGQDARQPTGTALIAVDRTGENMIILSPGANDELGPAADRCEGVLLTQAETPLAPLAAMMGRARGPVLFNPAPAVAGTLALLPWCDIVIVNEGELTALAGEGGSHEAQARILLCRAAQTIIVTLGRAGVLIVDRAATHRIAGHPVRAIDTTGAGDCFCGTLAAGIDQGLAIDEAAVRANAAAALSTTRNGAGSSMPNFAEVTAFLSERANGATPHAA